MSRKEWLEVGRQSLYFILAAAGVVLLAFIGDLLSDRPVSGERIVIILGLWLQILSLFMGLSPFAMDSRQKGMEYLLSLPFSRRRLLLIKFLPRLAAVVLFYLLFVLLYGFVGNQAFAGGFTLYSLVYFALFIISFSLSVVDENFVVQSLWAGIALSGYLFLCLFVVMKGFSWKFNMPVSWAVSNAWQGLSYDTPTLLSAGAVFLLMAMPFILSFFLAFKRFDLKPARAFNRRQLRFFAPLLLLAFAASLGITYAVQKASASDDAEFFLLGDRRVLKAGFPGKLVLYEESGRRPVSVEGAFYWQPPVLEKGERLYLGGYDTRTGERFLGMLDRSDMSWKELHRCPNSSFVTPGFRAFRFDGERLFYLRRDRGQVERSGRESGRALKSDLLELVRIDPADGASRAIVFRSPLFRNYFEPWFHGSDVRDGRRFWLIAQRGKNVLRLWEDGRVEDLGVSREFVCVNDLLLSCQAGFLQVRRLRSPGSEIVAEIPGDFSLVFPYIASPSGRRLEEMYAVRDRRIVRIHLDTLDIDDVGPHRGRIRLLASGDFYYVEFENWPRRPSDRWRRLYRLQAGRMILLKQFDLAQPGSGYVEVGEHGVIVHERQGASVKFFAFPDLRELKFKKLN